MTWLFAYMGGIIAIICILIAAGNNNLLGTDMPPFGAMTTIILLWPIIFPILMFKKL